MRMNDQTVPGCWSRPLVRWVAQLVAVAAIAATFSGCDVGPQLAEARQSFSPPRRVFLLTIDTLRADHLGAYGYDRPTSPFLDSLAAEGTLFQRAIVQWPKTGSSFASMFTGFYPATTGLQAKAALTLPAEYNTLPELFQSEGYSTVAVVGNAVLDSEMGWRQGFDEYVELWRRPGLELETPVDWKRALDATQVTALGMEVLERYRESDRLFAWIHYIDPHAPYILPPGETNPFLSELPPPGVAAKVSKATEVPKGLQLEGRTDPEFYVAQYDANIAVADRYIETLYRRLEELGLLEDSLIVVTSDHGESLGEHRVYGHGRTAYNDTIHVPLIVVDPLRVAAGRRVEQPVELVGLLPTFRAVLGAVPDDEPLDGVSFANSFLVEGLSVEQPEPTKVWPRDQAYAESGQGRPVYRTVQDANRKLITFTSRKPRTVRYKLYDLANDPEERRELLRRGESLPEDLVRHLNARIEEARKPNVAPVEETVSPEVERALRALGYVD